MIHKSYYLLCLKKRFAWQRYQTNCKLRSCFQFRETFHPIFIIKQWSNRQGRRYPYYQKWMAYFYKIAWRLVAFKHLPRAEELFRNVSRNPNYLGCQLMLRAAWEPLLANSNIMGLEPAWNRSKTVHEPRIIVSGLGFK